MEDYVIIISTHSKYLEIVNYFLKLLQINWKNCPYRIIISITGEKKYIDGYKNIYNGKKASLIDCIINATKEINSKYYICFLGDAFISKKMDNINIEKLLNTLVDSNVEYCSINYVKNFKKKKIYNSYFRYINGMDRYSHSFVSFIASSDYIEKTLSKFESDFEFEKHYINKAENRYYYNHLAINKNYFNILPSITKAEWDWINYHKLLRIIPEIKETSFKVGSFWTSLLYHFRNLVNNHINGRLRKSLKKSISAILKKEFINIEEN